MCALFAILTLEAITDQIIADCMRIAKSKAILASLGVTNLANEVLHQCIVNDDRFWSAIAKVEQKE